MLSGQKASRVVQGDSGPSSSCVWNPRVFADDARLGNLLILHIYSVTGLGRQPWALSLPDKELCLREALAVCTPPAPEPSAKRPGS